MTTAAAFQFNAPSSSKLKWRFYCTGKAFDWMKWKKINIKSSVVSFFRKENTGPLDRIKKAIWQTQLSGSVILSLVNTNIKTKTIHEKKIKCLGLRFSSQRVSLKVSFLPLFDAAPPKTTTVLHVGVKVKTCFPLINHNFTKRKRKKML